MTSPHDFSPMDLCELEEILKEIGLNEKESKVYLELLHLGEGFPGHISSKTGINRTTVYITLKALNEKGLVEMKNKWGQQCFTAINCDAFLNAQKSTLEDKLKKIEEARKINKITKCMSKIKPENEDEIIYKVIIETASLKTNPTAAAFFLKNNTNKRAEVKSITSTKLGKYTLKLLKNKFYKLSTPYQNPVDKVGECIQRQEIIQGKTLEGYICPTVSKETAKKIMKMGAGPAIIVPLNTHGAILFAFRSEEEIKKKYQEILTVCETASQLLEIHIKQKNRTVKLEETNKKTIKLLKRLLPKLTKKEQEAIRELQSEILQTN